MDFSHYTDDPVTLAVELVNTYGWVSGSDSIATPEALSGFLSATGGPWTEGIGVAGPDDVTAIHQLRRELHAVFEAVDANEAADRLNRILKANGAAPQLSMHGGLPHLHFEPDDGSVARWVAVVTAMGLATVLAEEGLERLGICQAETCRDAYVDTSRNRSRRHCSTTCSTREAVAAHRQRRRSSD